MASPANTDNSTVLSWITAARAGDQTAFACLLSRYTPLIEAALAPLRKHYPAEENDLRQESYLAFVRAIDRFDLSQDAISFGLFAKICVNHALQDAISHLHAPTLPFEETPEEALLSDASDSDSDPTRRLREEEDYTALCRIITEVLSPLENTIWQSYIAGKTAAEIADRLGRDTRSVHNAIYRIRHKLRTVDAIRRRQ